MPDDDPEDVDEELGETSERLGGIAGRFGSGGETSDTSETTGTTETSEDSEATASASGETTETSGTTEASEATETIEASETPAPGDADFRIREHWNGRTIYLPDDAIDDLDLLYQEIGLEWRREHGGELPKNERFYPAVVRVALEHPELLRAELGLDG